MMTQNGNNKIIKNLNIFKFKGFLNGSGIGVSKNFLEKSFQ